MPEYMTVQMKRDHNYGDRQLRAGETYELPRREAALLIAARRATKEKPLLAGAVEVRTKAPPVEPVAPPAPPSEPTPPVSPPLPATVRPADTQPPVQPEDLAALRAEYQAKVGKQAYWAWDAPTLRQKMAEAKVESAS